MTRVYRGIPPFGESTLYRRDKLNLPSRGSRSSVKSSEKRVSLPQIKTVIRLRNRNSTSNCHFSSTIVLLIIAYTFKRTFSRGVQYPRYSNFKQNIFQPFHSQIFAVKYLILNTRKFSSLLLSLELFITDFKDLLDDRRQSKLNLKEFKSGFRFRRVSYKRPTTRHELSSTLQLIRVAEL